MDDLLDATDLRILEILQEDASLSAIELAEKANLSSSPCWRRVQRLREQGYIRREVALLDRRKLGLNAQIFAEVKISAHGRANLADFSKAVQSFPEVLECFVMMGHIDFLLRIVTEDVEAYERFFFDKLSRVPGIQEVNSIVALSEIKSSTALPLRTTPRSATSRPKRGPK
jgi:Lrp/AsnC family transcriptional regulator